MINARDLNNKEKKDMENKQGISLIVLVITIIVMIILAGTIILTLGNNGIINKASQAVDMTNINNVQEVASLLWADAYMDGARSENELTLRVVNELAKMDGINISEYIVTVTTSGVAVEKAEYSYYSTLKAAVDAVNNGTAGEDSVDKTNAVAGIHTSNGTTRIVLLKDTIEQQTIRPAKDMTINLGGHTLYFENTNLGIEGEIGSTNTIIIDGMLEGSTINLKADVNCSLLQTGTSKLIINGGNYIVEGSENDKTTASGITSTKAGSEVIISNANIKATAKGRATALATNNIETTNIIASNCDILATSTGDISYGYRGQGNATMSNCTVKALANYKYNRK